MSTITDYSGSALGKVGVMRIDEVESSYQQSLLRHNSWLALCKVK